MTTAYRTLAVLAALLGAFGLGLLVRGSASAQTPSAVTITKTDSPASVAAGANVTYTITVTNGSPADATGILVDALPAATTFVSLNAPGGWSCTTPVVGANGIVQCSNNSYAPGPHVFTLAVRVLPSTPAGSITNTASISGEADGRPYSVQVSENTTVFTSAAVVVDKTGPATVTPGQFFSYTITLSQQGPSDVANAQFDDVLPPLTTFSSLIAAAGWTCTTPAVGGSGTVHCQRAVFPANTIATFTLEVRLSPTHPGGGTLVNEVVYSQDTSQSNEQCCDSHTSAVAPPSADLRIAKSDSPNPVLPGANITYTIRLSNLGPSTLTSPTINDTIPAGTTFVSLAAPAGYTCTTPAVGGTGQVQCSGITLAALAPENTFTLVVRVNNGTPNGTVISNTATGDSTTPDPVLPNTASTTTTVTNLADISITKTDTPDPATAGGNITYTLTVNNSGPQPAPNVRMSDSLPANTTFVSLTAPAGWTCESPAVGGPGIVTCNIASLAASTPVVFTLVVRVDPSTPDNTTITNTATVALVDPNLATATIGAPADDPNPGNNTATATTTIGNAADLALTKTAVPSTPAPGTNVTYTLTLTNNGPSPAQNVVLSDALPAGTTFVSASQASGPTFTLTTPAVGGAGTVTMTGASLASGAAASFTIVVRLPLTGAGAVVNSATVTSSTPDPVVANNTATVTVILGQLRADVAVTKTGTPDAVPSGREIVYSLTATNLGADDALNVVLSDALPPNVTFSSLAQLSGPTFACTTPAAGANGTVSCSIASLAPRATAAFTLIVRTGNLGRGATLVNSASITTTSIDTNLANNGASVTTLGIGQGIPQAQQNPGAIAIVGNPPRTPTPQVPAAVASQQGGSSVVAPLITPPRTGDAGLLASGS